MRGIVIFAKKSNPVYLTSASGSRDAKIKKLNKQGTRPRYVEEERGASGSTGTVIPREEIQPEPVAAQAKAANVAVPSSPPAQQMVKDPSRLVMYVSSGIVGLWLFGLVFKRVFNRKPKVPVVTVIDMEKALEEKEKTMEEEFTKILSEQLEQKEAEFKTQLLEERGKTEADFDARLAARERQVRKALEKEFTTQLETETKTLKEELEKEKASLRTQLTTDFEEQKAKIEMEWMKKIEEKEKVFQQNVVASSEAQKLIQELKASQETLKMHESALEAQLKEYESMLSSLKESHKAELESAMTGYQTEIRRLKEEIRYQEKEIERRRAAKQEELLAVSVNDSFQENGHLTEEQTEKEASVALKTKPKASPTKAKPLKEVPVHQNGAVVVEEEPEETLQKAEIRMIAAGTILPHVDKIWSGGEDAFFVSSAGYGAIGVADGVGSWGGDGIDASRYSKELMAAVQEYLANSSGEEYNVKDLIERAHDRAHSPGSATICVAKVDPDGLLEVANIGDCGLRVIRGSKCVFATEAMAHEFNMPYQIANPAILPETDWPSDAELYSFELREGDVIVMGSDGLFDNVWDDDLARIVNGFVGNQSLDKQTADSVSKRIAEVAHYNAKQKKIRSPWAVHAAASDTAPLWRKLFPEGGKMDDCTVVVGFAKGFN